MKKCKICEEYKKGSEFYSSKTNLDRLDSYCKKCRNLYGKIYREKNMLKIKEGYERWKEKNKDYKRNYYIKNRVIKPKKIFEPRICIKCGEKKEITEFPKVRWGKQKRLSFLKTCIECESKYKSDPKGYTRKRKREYNKRKIKEDVLYKLGGVVRSHVKRYINSKRKKEIIYNINGERISSLELIGCTLSQLKEYIENQFKDGMSWSNHGHKGWHIDHIVPLSSAKTVEELIRLNHYTNIQPLWWYENFKKGSKILEDSNDQTLN